MAGFFSLIPKALSWLGGGSAAAKGLGTALELGGAAHQIFGRPAGGGARGQAYDQLMGAFKAADDAGIHRLAVAGSPAGYSPAPSNAAEGLMAAGRALGNGPSKKEEQLLDAQIAETRSRTMLNEANYKRALSGPQAGLGGARNIDPLAAALDAAAGGGPRGVRNEPEPNLPARQKVTLGNNDAVGPNPEAFEIGISELVAGGLIYGPQWLANALQTQLRKIPQKPPTKPKARERAGAAVSNRNRRAQQSDYLFPRR